MLVVRRLLPSLAVAFLLLGSPPSDAAAPRSRVVRLPLAGPLASSDAEVSGLAWAPGGDGRPVLLLLAEEPLLFADGTRSALAALPRAAVLDAIVAGRRAAPLEPVPLGWRLAPDVAARVTHVETAGYEAVAVQGDRLALAHEQGGGGGESLLLEGRLVVLDGRLTAHLDRARRLLPPPLAPEVASQPSDVQAVRGNKSYEALVALASGWLALYECGGARWVRSREDVAVPMPAIPYRVTDASALERDGRFWVLDYHFRGRECLPSPAVLQSDHATGGTPPGGEHVERLLALRHRAGRLERTADEPVWLALEAEPRNWEGLVRLVDAGRGLDGFLLVTDRYPIEAGGTILAYVPRGPDVP